VPRITFLILLALAGWLRAQSSALTVEEQRGQQIYEVGTSPTGKVIQAVLAGGLRVPASITPCANCHGRGGDGKPEGGVTPSNLTWDTLTKPYDVTNADGRTRPAYNERLLKRAIALGVDPAGNVLNAAMPRFQLSSQDASDLLVYMKRLGETTDPAVTATTVRIGVILQQASDAIPTGHALRQAATEYFESVNMAGGVYSRRVGLVFVTLPADPARRASALRDFLRDQRPFAVLGDFTGAEAEIADILRVTQTPGIATLAPLPEPGLPLSAFTFYLDDGLKEEVDSLVRFSAERYPRKDLTVAIVESDHASSGQAARWLRTRLTESGRLNIMLGERGRPVDADLIFCLGPASDLRLTREAVVLLPGSLMGNPAEMRMRLTPSTRVFAAVSAGTPEFGTKIEFTLRPIWTRATVSAALMIEAMKTAGRGLSRSSLIEAMESFREVRTDLGVSISYGPARRIGAIRPPPIIFEYESGRLIPVHTSDTKHPFKPQ
jgi:mono/diheme cytochrome c family protein